MLREIRLGHPADLEGWRTAARRLLGGNVAPFDVVWRVEEDTRDLFAAPESALPEVGEDVAIRVPRAFMELADAVIAHREESRFHLLYSLLWRLHHERRSLLRDPLDGEVRRAMAMARHVRRESHKMTAFVRFREVAAEGGPCFVAWFEPEHHVLDRTAGFFVDRFAGMNWSILTPARSAHWNGRELRMAGGVSRAHAPDADDVETIWRVYYAGIFNPARLKPAAMKAEMPVRYWRNLPEAQDIPRLMRDAGRRVDRMLAAESEEGVRSRRRTGSA